MDHTSLSTRLSEDDINSIEGHLTHLRLALAFGDAKEIVDSLGPIEEAVGRLKSSNSPVESPSLSELPGSIKRLAISLDGARHLARGLSRTTGCAVLRVLGDRTAYPGGKMVSVRIDVTI